jgi:choline transporter-like protein 2/4/5
MFLMRWIAPLLVWLSIIGIIIIFAGAGFIFLYNAGTFQQFGLQLGNLGIPTLAPNQYYNIYGYVSFGLALLFFLVFLCCCSRIRLAIAVCKVAGQFVIRVAQIMLVPIVMTALVLGLWAFGLSSLVYIISTAQFVATNDVFTSINDYTQRSLGMFYYFFFGILWTNAFLGAVSLFIVASSCCLWYFSRGPGDELSSPVLTSLYRIFRYHMGSLAFGALIIAVIQFI